MPFALGLHRKKSMLHENVPFIFFHKSNIFHNSKQHIARTITRTTTHTNSMDLKNEDSPTFIKLHAARSDLKSILKSSLNIDTSYKEIDKKFESIQQSLNTSSKRLAPLQSLSIANKALDTRINRATSPALSLITSFKLAESLQHKLLDYASELMSEAKSRKKWLKKLIKYVDCVEKLNEAINSISKESEATIHKLQEVVEFLSRTKATDHYRAERLRETLITIKAVCETEVDAMRFDGVLDEALLNLQDEYEGLLLKLRHRDVGDRGPRGDEREEDVRDGLGSDLEVGVLRRISETLAANDCLDICIDMFVKLRYRRAAKALMRLNPDYLKTYSPEQIDDMEWETLETAISLWIQHFELATKTVLISEKILCIQILGNIMEGSIWPECFIKIADKIMAVFFRFGEGVARSSKEPQKLFKLLDMFDSLEKLKPEFTEIFDGESGADICSRFREFEKLLVNASTKVFWEFGLQIEGNQDGLPPPQDGSVPKLVRYSINYLKNLMIMDSYGEPMGKVLKIELMWKSGIVSNDGNDQDLLKDAVCNVMEAIQRNIEAKKSRYKDKVLAQVFSMNTYWYIYMRTRNTELGKILGEPYMKKMYRNVAEESAYLYQKHAWGSLVRLLEREEVKRESSKEAVGGVVRGKMEAFIAGFDEMCKKHKNSYKIVSDADLRKQMKDATIKLVLPAYTEFFDAYSSVLQQGKAYLSPESIESLLRQIFEGGDDQIQGGSDRKPNLSRLDSKDRMEQRVSVENRQRFGKDYRRSEFINSDF